MKHFKFSIVIPIYNVEKYLEEAIESITNQTIGFKENIQIILVNDGSKDKSEEICLKYKEKYPENIIYIKQENRGVSSARNKGIEFIEGKYVNYLDGDDKWNLNALEIIYEFFEKNYNYIDFAVARKQLFEAKDGFHVLDYKFQETKIVDILEDYRFVQMDVTSVFIKSSVAKEYKFNEKLKYGEDADYINRILLKRKKYGVIREAIHLYRKRLDETSALQIAKKSKSWYIDTIEYFHKKVIENSINIYGKIIPYVQFMIMYDLQWRIKNTNYGELDEQEKKQYQKNIVELLKNIEDYIIIEQKNIYSKFKLYTLNLKYGKDIINDLVFKDGIFYFKNLKVYKIKNKEELFRIKDIELKRKKLIINGKTLFALPVNTYEVYYNTNLDNKMKIDLIEDKSKEITTFIGDKLINYVFNIEIPIKNINRINFIFKYKNGIEQNLDIGIERNTNLNEVIYKNKSYEIIYKKKFLFIKKTSLKNRIKKLLKL